MRKYLASIIILVSPTVGNAIEPLSQNYDPASHVPFATYYDSGSGQYYYYDNQKATFFVFDSSEETQKEESKLEADQEAETNGDPTGLMQSVNYYRSLRGLPSLIFDPYLYHRAINNNAWQQQRGLGHHDVPSAQNSAWGNMDIISVLNMWAGSPGHAATLFGYYTYGAIAFDGLYWTLNAR